jgi:DNA-binding IscR family transcriptional regulator
MPFDTTAKVMQLMNTHGILKSSKGIKGGYSLSKDLREISYMNLVRLIEGKELGRICVTAKGTCELIDKCNIITPVELLNKKLSHFLEDLSLADILLTDQVRGQVLDQTEMPSSIPLFPFILNPDSILPPSLAPKYTREVK